MGRGSSGYEPSLGPGKRTSSSRAASTARSRKWRGGPPTLAGGRRQTSTTARSDTSLDFLRTAVVSRPASSACDPGLAGVHATTRPDDARRGSRRNSGLSHEQRADERPRKGEGTMTTMPASAGSDHYDVLVIGSAATRWHPRRDLARHRPGIGQASTRSLLARRLPASHRTRLASGPHLIPAERARRAAAAGCRADAARSVTLPAGAAGSTPARGRLTGRRVADAQASPHPIPAG